MACAAKPNPAAGGHRFSGVVKRTHHDGTDAPPPLRIKTGQCSADRWGMPALMELKVAKGNGNVVES